MKSQCLTLQRRVKHYCDFNLHHTSICITNKHFFEQIFLHFLKNLEWTIYDFMKIYIMTSSHLYVNKEASHFYSRFPRLFLPQNIHIWDMYSKLLYFTLHSLKRYSSSISKLYWALLYFFEYCSGNFDNKKYIFINIYKLCCLKSQTCFVYQRFKLILLH